MGNQIEFRHYKYFLAVAKELHFRRAAEQLYISQPGLSRQIKQMEDDLGIKLFERHNRKVELTPSGEYLYNGLLKNFKQLEELLNHAKLLNDGIAGKLKIGYVGSAIQKEIPNLLLRFQEINQNVLINLSEMDNNRQIQAILKKKLISVLFAMTDCLRILSFISWKKKLFHWFCLNRIKLIQTILKICPS